MKAYLFAGITLLLMCTALCSAQERWQGGGNFGAGFVLGEPTGIAWKYRMNQINAVDGAIGFSPYNAFRVHVDYLWQSYPFSERNLAMHYGAGVAFGNGRTFYRDEELGFGVRGVIGLNYLIRNSPVDLFFEVAPIVVLTPNSTSGIDLGLGARVYF